MGSRGLVAVTVHVVWAQVFWSQRRLEMVLAPPQNHTRNKWVTLQSPPQVDMGKEWVRRRDGDRRWLQKKNITLNSTNKRNVRNRAVRVYAILECLKNKDMPHQINYRFKSCRIDPDMDKEYQRDLSLWCFTVSFHSLE